MNLAVSQNLDSLTPAKLPGPDPAGPARILFLTIGAFGLMTAGQRLEEQSALHPNIHAVHLYIKPRRLLRHLCRRVPIITEWGMHPNRLRWAWKVMLRKWFERELPPHRFDVIHCISQAIGGAVLELPAATRPALAVYTDCTTMCAHRDLEPEAPLIVKRPLLREDRRLFQAADLSAGWSTWATSSMVKDCGADPSRVHVVPPGIHVPKPNPRAHATRAGTGLVRAIFVGNDWDRKGGPRLLRWHQDRWRDRIELHVCSAKAPADPSCHNVVWHGATGNAKVVHELLPRMDLFILPTWKDHSGVAIAEAQGCGLPVVSSRVGGIADLVDDGTTAFLCDTANDQQYVQAVEKLLADPILRERMGAAAYDRALTKLDSAVIHRAWLDKLVELAVHRRARGQAPA